MAAELFHGSPIGGLKQISTENSHFGEKIFATSELQKAIRYLPDRESGGQSWISFDGDSRMFVFGADPRKLLNMSGSIYVIPAEGFAFDPHKGNRPWVLSRSGLINVAKEVVFPSILDAWTAVGIYAVPQDMESILENDTENRPMIIHEIIAMQENILEDSNRTASDIIARNFTV